VVHFEDAEAALFAVVGADRLPGLFGGAFAAIFNLHKFALERRFHSLRHAARVSESSSEVGDDGGNTKTVENEAVSDALPGERDSLNRLHFKNICVVPVENAELVSTEPPVHD